MSKNKKQQKYATAYNKICDKIITTKQVVKCYERYVAISYVWADFQDIEELYETIATIYEIYTNQYMSLITEKTRIWLDRLSNINEDDYSGEMGIRDMNKVYHNAVATIALLPHRTDYLTDIAVQGLIENVSHNECCNRMPVSRMKKDSSGISVECGCSYVRDISELTKKTLLYYLANSNWMKRAWTYQEQLLSDVILMYNGDDQLYNITRHVRTVLLYNTNSSNVNIEYNDDEISIYMVSTLPISEHVKFIGKQCANGTELKSYTHDMSKNDLLFNTTQKLALSGSMSVVDAIVALGGRQMGEMNTGYEPIPIMSLVSQKSYKACVDNGSVVEVDENYKYQRNITPLLLGENFSKNSGLSWLPLRLPNISLKKMETHLFRIKTDNVAELVTQLYYDIDEEQYVLYLGLTETNEDIYAILERINYDTYYMYGKTKTPRLNLTLRLKRYRGVYSEPTHKIYISNIANDQSN